MLDGKYYVYAIQSGKDRRIYVGLSNDIGRRVKEHNLGKNKSTKAYVPWNLIYQKEFNSRPEARKEEKRLKSGYGKEFLKSLRIHNIPVWRNGSADAC